jgi:phosphatidate cytidylyltransferase
MEDRDERLEATSADAADPGFADPADVADVGDPGAPPVRTHSVSRVRIEGLEASVAAGLETGSVPASPPPGGTPAETAEEGTDPDPVPSWSGILPDWRDPPTREVPRVLLDHPLAEQGPSTPGPVWRQVESDWDHDDLTFADLVNEGSAIAEHGLSPDEPDPFGFDFAVEGDPAPSHEPSEPVASPPPAADHPSPRKASHRAPVLSFPRRRRPEDGPALTPPTVPVTNKRNPVIATVTGVATGLVVLLCFLAGPPIALLLVSVVLVLAIAECYQAFRHARYRPAVLLGLLGVPGATVAGYFAGPPGLLIVGAGFVMASMTWFFMGVTKRAPLSNILATLSGWVWIGFLGGFAGLLLDPRVFPHRHGIAYMLGAIEATVAYDVGGYAFGSWMGTHRLAPSISPNKTWEGLIGGCFVAIAVSVGLVSHMSPWTWPHALWLGLVVAVFAPLGDLAESMIKRALGVKDMGTILPEHGGFLDRIDALLFVLPATYCLVRLFHG